MAVWMQSFINSPDPSNIHYEYGWVFMLLWVIFLIFAALFMLYCSFYLNLKLTQSYFQEYRKNQNHEAMLSKDIDFKSRFVEENPGNFMMQYEAVNSQQFLTHSKQEHQVKYEVERKRREVAWLEKNGIDPQLVYPGWSPAKVSQMYRLGKRKPKKQEPQQPAPAAPALAPAYVAEDAGELQTENPPPSPKVEAKSKPVFSNKTKVEDAPAPFLLDLLAPANLPSSFAPPLAPINPEKGA